MHEITSFCQDNDVNAPDFTRVAIRYGKLAHKWGEPGMEAKMSETERSLVQVAKQEYYKENWQTAILRMLRYQRP